MKELCSDQYIFSITDTYLVLINSLFVSIIKQNLLILFYVPIQLQVLFVAKKQPVSIIPTNKNFQACAIFCSPRPITNPLVIYQLTNCSRGCATWRFCQYLQNVCWFFVLFRWCTHKAVNAIYLSNWSRQILLTAFNKASETYLAIRTIMKGSESRSKKKHLHNLAALQHHIYDESD